MLCLPIDHSPASYEARLGLDSVVPLLGHAQTFAAAHASDSGLLSLATRVLRLLRKEVRDLCGALSDSSAES